MAKASLVGLGPFGRYYVQARTPLSVSFFFFSGGAQGACICGPFYGLAPNYAQASRTLAQPVAGQAIRAAYVTLLPQFNLSA